MNASLGSTCACWWLPVRSGSRVQLTWGDSALCFAGGRNATVGMVAASGFYRRTSIIAMALFLQYWFWFPLSYMLALSFSATAAIGVTADLKLPKFHLVCHCKKGTFAYAKPVDDSSKKKVRSQRGSQCGLQAWPRLAAAPEASVVCAAHAHAAGARR
jgi:hypothetical protein